MTQAGHKGKAHPVPWNAALALPGALPDSRKGSEGWETGTSKCCSFIWQHRLLPAGILARHKGCSGWGGNRKGQRKGHGLTPNIWCAYEQISASTVSGKWNSLSLEYSLKEYQMPNEHLPFSPQWPNIRPPLSPRNWTNRSQTNNVLPHHSTEGRNLSGMLFSTFSNKYC